MLFGGRTLAGKRIRSLPDFAVIVLAARADCRFRRLSTAHSGSSAGRFNILERFDNQSCQPGVKRGGRILSA
jgi:hypothetical protein